MAEVEETSEEQEKKGGSNTLIIVVIVLLIVTIVIGGLVAYFAMGSSDEEMTDVNLQEMKQKSRKQDKNSNFLTIGPIYPMDKFIVNLVSNGGRRYLKTSMDVELSSEEMSMELDSKKSLIRDIMIRILSSKTFEEISTRKGKENLKEELVEALNEVLADGYIKHIFLTSFVIQ